MNIGIRIIDFLTFPRESGDCVVLLLAHPGLNLLGRYFPPRKVNDLLLADTSGIHPYYSHGDIHMVGLDESETNDEMEVFDVMDIASFIEYVHLSTHNVVSELSVAQVRYPNDTLPRI